MKLLLFDWHGDGHHGVYMESAVSRRWPSAAMYVLRAGPDNVLTG